MCIFNFFYLYLGFSHNLNSCVISSLTINAWQAYSVKELNKLNGLKFENFLIFFQT